MSLLAEALIIGGVAMDLVGVGLTMYLIGLVLKSSEGTGTMAALAAGVVVAGVIAAVLWTRIVGGRVRDQAARAEKDSDGEELPEQ